MILLMIFPMIDYVAPVCCWLSQTIPNHSWQSVTVLTVPDHPRLSPSVWLFSIVSNGPWMSLTVSKPPWPSLTIPYCPWLSLALIWSCLRGSVEVFGGPPWPSTTFLGSLKICWGISWIMIFLWNQFVWNICNWFQCSTCSNVCQIASM